MDQYTGPEQRKRRTEDVDRRELVESIVKAIETRAPPCLTEDEQQWVKLAIKAQADRIKLRQAIIEKSLTSLVVGLAGWLGFIVIEWFKGHPK